MTKRDEIQRPHELDAVRLDVWLDVACLFRTRSEAQNACRGGKVTVNAPVGEVESPGAIG